MESGRFAESVPLAEGQFSQLRVHYDEGRRTIWVEMNAKPQPTFTLSLLRDLLSVYHFVRASQIPVDFWVTCSGYPKMFNTGGDLAFFVDCIRSGDRTSLRSYARTCIDCINEMMHGVGMDAVTIALVEGNALGGGYEAALSHHFVLAQEDVRLGFPEIRFNLFPGMGAYPLVAQRAGARTAEELIAWDEGHPVSWHAERGLVDRVFAPGTGYDGTLRFIDEVTPRLNGIRAMIRARHTTLPVTRDVLMRITEDWAEAAFHVGDEAVAYMERLVGLQDRRFGA